MALHPQFPTSPYAPLIPEHRWFPADEVLRASSYEKLLPPLVAKVRKDVQLWRDQGYPGCSPTSLTLLHHWFETDHLLENADHTLSTFRYYFAQREAVETVIWLHEVRQARDKYDLLRFDASGAVSTGMFDEDWPRYVLKMATGAGKTKVLSLLIAWCYFHKLYEPGSTLSRNFLVIAPNIIVLDRLRADFDGLKIFFNDPVLPPNGQDGHNWRDDFQITLHLQDDVRIVRETGNFFLTNIHRVFLGEVREPSMEDDDLRDYFLADAFGAKPAGKTTDSKTDLGEIIREIEELAVFNDEAHHIHDARMAWFKSIQDIHHKMLQKDLRLALQVDVTATPRHDNGAIFVQTVSDYPLVEAIHQNVVKHPVLPDLPSQTKLVEKKSAIFTGKYDDYLKLGIEEWRKSYAEHKALGKKAVLFVMVDDTRNCDEVGAHLEKICPELQGAVLVIHTKNNGEISEAASGKNKEELERLRKEANEIDTLKSPHKAIVSVLMLKEGWDVKNVTTIVGLRAYAAKSNILPEQTLGRGLRRMYFGNDVVRETVSVLGTAAFMEFVETIQSEGVDLEYRPMGKGTGGRDSLIVEVDAENEGKDIDALDIPLPRLSRRYQREFKNLAGLDPAAFGNLRLQLKAFTDEETREIVFKTMLDAEIHHTIQLDGMGPADYRSVVAFFARQLLKDLRLVGGYEVLYPKVRDFMRDHLFEPTPVDLEDPVVLRNLSEPDAGKILYDSFKLAINALTIEESGTTRIEDYIRLRDTRPFRTDYRAHLDATKSIFNKVVGEPHSGNFELRFANFLEAATDVSAFAKNYLAVGFKLDYVKANGDLANYHTDFIVRTTDGTVWLVETKGRAELDLPQKMTRLGQWCADATTASEDSRRYDFVYVDQPGFEEHRPKTFAALAASFTEYKA
ncbi:MAG: DEAD/DEAH box helicase family protein [Cephaloticoccus sp.]|nr:DEAD/DEAH box helicase family protein [Akkermansiaceae bacterium]MCF7760101.1 DEAD/DEAH box helicase family protein [Cephaloticoccus sp.]